MLIQNDLSWAAFSTEDERNGFKDTLVQAEEVLQVMRMESPKGQGLEKKFLMPIRN